MIKVGIGITCTSSRFNLVIESLKFIESFKNYQYTISVFCDQELSQQNKINWNEIQNNFKNVIFKNEYVHSIAKAKNKSLKPLIQNNCQFFILLDDDCFIINQTAIDYYVQACKDYHFLHFHLNNFRKGITDTQKLIKKYDQFTLNSYCFDNGVFLIFDKFVYDKVGAFDQNYDGWGGEHGEFQRRASFYCLDNKIHHLSIPEAAENFYILSLDYFTYRNLYQKYCQFIEKNYSNLIKNFKESSIKYSRSQTNSKNSEYTKTIKYQ